MTGSASQTKPEAGTTSKLHPDDQAVLDRYRAEEKIRREEIEACSEAKTAAKREMDELNRQIAEEEAQLKKDRQQLDRDRKMLDPAAVAERKAELEAQKEKIAQQKAKSKQLRQTASRKCKSPLPNSRNCVQQDPSAKMDDPLKDVAETINKDNGTQIDFKALVGQEGAYSTAYVPWWPIPKGKDAYTTTVKYPRSDDPVQFRKGRWPTGSIPVIAGDDNHSGASIGVGVDFGDQDKQVYFKDLNTANKKYKTLTEAELEQLKKKIDPYFKRMRSEACEFLRKNPLALNRREMDLLHLRAANNAITLVKKNNPNFLSFSVDQQTSMFKKIYNLGS